jgi:alkanesulfonate monooxygenase
LAELAKEGAALDHYARYQRTYEFMEIVSHLSENDGPFSYDGQFYQIKNATLFPKLHKKPKTYIAGASMDAKRVASAFGSVYITWAEPLVDVKHHIETVRSMNRDNPSLEFGLRVNVLIRKREEEAMEELQLHMKKSQVDPRSILPLVSRFSDSVGQKTMMKLAAGGDKYDSCLYTSTIGARTGSVPFLAGTPQQVRDALQRYIELGIRHFIFASISHDKEAVRIGDELLGKL